MKKKVSPILGVALMVCMMAPNVFAQGVPAPKSDDSLNQGGQVKTIFSYKNEIGLTDDQELKLKGLLYDEQTSLDADNATLKTLGSELSSMVDSKGDMQVIKSKLEEIAKIQVEVSYRNIEDSRKIEGILTPTQLDQWKVIQKNSQKS